MYLGRGLYLDLDRYVPLILPAFMAAAARPLSERLPPRVATWVLTLTSLVLTLVWAVNLAELTISGSMRVPQVAAVGHLSLPIIQRSGDTSLPVAVAAGLALTLAVVAVTRAALRQSRMLRTAAETARELPGHSRVAVVDDPVPEAFAVPGKPGRIVVSSGMLAALDPAERTALLAHESAHLDDRHHLFRTAVHLAAAANPLLRPVRKAVAYSTERWADERAALATGDRRVAARAIGKAALASAESPPRPPRSLLLNFGGPGPVPRRVAALLAPPPAHRAGKVGIASSVLLVLLALASIQGEAHDLHALVEHAQAENAQLTAPHHP